MISFHDLGGAAEDGLDLDLTDTCIHLVHRAQWFPDCPSALPFAQETLPGSSLRFIRQRSQPLVRQSCHAHGPKGRL